MLECGVFSPFRVVSKGVAVSTILPSFSSSFPPSFSLFLLSFSSFPSFLLLTHKHHSVAYPALQPAPRSNVAPKLVGGSKNPHHKQHGVNHHANEHVLRWSPLQTPVHTFLPIL